MTTGEVVATVEVEVSASGIASSSASVSATVEVSVSTEYHVVRLVEFLKTVHLGDIDGLNEGEAIHSWWKADYLYRRPITVIAPGEPVPQGHFVETILPRVISDNHKIREDFEDIEVIEAVGAELAVLAREVEQLDNGDILVRFLLQEDLESNQILAGRYYIYYGNPELTNFETRPIILDGINLWPVTFHVPGNSSPMTFTRPGEHWIEGVSSERYARASVFLYATDLRIHSEKAIDRGIMQVRVDDGDWQDVDLYSFEAETVPVHIFSDLSPALHEFQMRVSGRSADISLGEEINIQTVDYVKAVQAIEQGEQVLGIFWVTNFGGL
jgi:hypothetical protein